MSRIRDAEHSQLVEQMRRRIAELHIEVSEHPARHYHYYHYTQRTRGFKKSRWDRKLHFLANFQQKVVQVLAGLILLLNFPQMVVF